MSNDKIIIGCDPDSKKHGIALYQDGKLKRIESWGIMDAVIFLRFHSNQEDYCLELHIEDVCANNAAFAKKGVASQKAATNINRSIGKCQQAQIELERVFEHYGIPIVRHKISKKWKSQQGKAEFERNTGWSGRSNEDTRSAAWFGFLGINA